jgi:hypothetical protein
MKCALLLLVLLSAFYTQGAHAARAKVWGTSSEPNEYLPSDGTWLMTAMHYGVRVDSNKTEERELFSDITNLRRQVDNLIAFTRRQERHEDTADNHITALIRAVRELRQEVKRTCRNWSVECIQICSHMMDTIPVLVAQDGKEDVTTRVTILNTRWAYQVECMDKCSAAPSL